MNIWFIDLLSFHMEIDYCIIYFFIYLSNLLRFNNPKWNNQSIIMIIDYNQYYLFIPSHHSILVGPSLINHPAIGVPPLVEPSIY